MALADRDYYGQPERESSSSRLTPVVKALLLANIAIFVLDYMILGVPEGSLVGLGPIGEKACFRISSGIHDLQLWQLLSFQFQHGGFLHILFNSIGLFIFGPWMERHFGSHKFTWYYLICGAAGALFYTLLASLGIIPTHALTPQGLLERPLVGASAGVIGCIVGVAALAPQMKVQMFFPPVVLTMRQFCIAILLFAVTIIAFNLDNAGGEAGHLGGAIAGLLLMRFTPWFSRGPRMGIRAPRFGQRYESKIRPRSELNLREDAEVDAILDKISNEGFQSLTDEEKAVLKRAAEKDPD